jgi:hypothetical protein
MNGLNRLAHLICEVHVCPPASTEIRQNVPAKLSKGTDFYVCKEPQSTTVLLLYSLLFTITIRYVIHRQLEIAGGEANIELFDRTSDNNILLVCFLNL